MQRKHPPAPQLPDRSQITGADIRRRHPAGAQALRQLPGTLICIRQPKADEAVLPGHHQVIPVRLHLLQEKAAIIVPDVVVNQDVSVPDHYADVHLACMQVDSAVVFRGRFVILNLNLLKC